MRKLLRCYRKDAILFLVAFLSVLFFTQCKKDKNKPAQDVMNANFLVGKKWQIKAMTITPGFGGETVTDIYKGMAGCSKDDYVVYYADGTGSEDEGPTKCDENLPQQRSFIWKLSADGTLDQPVDDDFIGTWKAVKKSATSFTITGTGKISDDTVIRTMVVTCEAI
ncbi:hypothetical protein [Chitinophaga arvensicola]|uniref:Lipocalin-like domain-containing protein n=1 Tax=Chitinophaga arvensicola TaxID=29529 RepID=A0A1I0S6M1_9BACT|nr:hypothetical protein [Chitinophaga arvensicola]SEW50942.1 hypothetical protein SAMN04488122_4027 [Chitinophaga arvensicola]